MICKSTPCDSQESCLSTEFCDFDKTCSSVHSIGSKCQYEFECYNPTARETEYCDARNSAFICKNNGNGLGNYMTKCFNDSTCYTRDISIISQNLACDTSEDKCKIANGDVCATDDNCLSSAKCIDSICTPKICELQSDCKANEFCNESKICMPKGKSGTYCYHEYECSNGLCSSFNHRCNSDNENQYGVYGKERFTNQFCANTATYESPMQNLVCNIENKCFLANGEHCATDDNCVSNLCIDNICTINVRSISSQSQDEIINFLEENSYLSKVVNNIKCTFDFV